MQQSLVTGHTKATQSAVCRAPEVARVQIISPAAPRAPIQNISLKHLGVCAVCVRVRVFCILDYCDDVTSDDDVQGDVFALVPSGCSGLVAGVEGQVRPRQQAGRLHRAKGEPKVSFGLLMLWLCQAGIFRGGGKEGRRNISWYFDGTE